MFIYRYIVYQTNTKAFDKDFQIELNPDNESYFCDLFNSLDLYYWYYLIRSKAFLEHQDMIEWTYVLSPKVFKEHTQPYMIVAHKDVNGVQNLEVLPRYFKNTRQHKITPNLWDLDNFELQNNKLGVSSYSKKSLYRNCLQAPPQLHQPQTQSLKLQNHPKYSDSDLNFAQNRIDGKTYLTPA